MNQGKASCDSVVRVSLSLFNLSKIFVGGLSWETTQDNFKKHFESYGEISDAKIMQNQHGNPRGFGFVTFKNPDVVHSVLEEKHFIDNKLVRGIREREGERERRSGIRHKGLKREREEKRQRK